MLFSADPTSSICRDKSSPDLTAPLCPPYAQTRLCDTSDGVCVTVCPLALRSPGMSVRLRLRVLSPAASGTVFFSRICRVCIRLGRMCKWNTFVTPPGSFIAHFNVRAPKHLPSPLPGVGARRRAANPPLLCLLFARQLIIEPASLYAAQQSIINPFHSGLPQ